jgi:hypothetical protein
MESMDGFTDPEKSLITPHSVLKITILVIADTIFLTNLQKLENRFERLSLDNLKMQVG